MKKGFVAALVLMSFLLVSVAFSYPAGSYTLTRDWGTSTSDWPDPRQLYNIAYNETDAASTGHLLVNAGNNIRIADRDTGNLIDTDFPIPGDYDRLSSWTAGAGAGFYFSVGIADDGKIYATDLSRSLILYQWANETAAATSQTVAGMMFVRSIAAKGAGVNTKLYVTGAADDGPGQILTTGDGSTFVVGETIPAPFAKSDIGVKNVNTIFGMQPWGANSANDFGKAVPYTQGWPDRWDKIGANWVRSVGFVPPQPPGGSSSYSMGGDWIQCDASDPRNPDGLLFYNLYYPWPDYLYLVNDVDGSLEAEYDMETEGVPTWGITYYGNCDTDSAQRKVYWAGRRTDTSRGVYGRLSVTYVGSGVSDWELY
jgi:hypothetical protein